MGPDGVEDRPPGPGPGPGGRRIIAAPAQAPADSLRMVIDEIQELLTAPQPKEADAYLERLESTLTAGYAHALQLEGERWRIERRIGELAARLADDEVDPHADELVELARRLTAANEDIASLRAALESLDERRAEVQTAA